MRSRCGVTLLSAQVAKAAGEGGSPAPPGQEEAREEVQVEVRPAREEAVGVEEEEVQEEVLPQQASLSVSTELGNREDPLYEPVSPTPLPDSPSDEAKPAAQEVRSLTSLHLTLPHLLTSSPYSGPPGHLLIQSPVHLFTWLLNHLLTCHLLTCSPTTCSPEMTYPPPAHLI